MTRLPVLQAGDLIAQKHLPTHLDPNTMSSVTTASRSRVNHTGTQTAATISDFTEAVQDAVAAMVVAGTNVTVAYNDAANTLTISSTATVNSPDAVLTARANHTGTQTADTVIDGTTNKAYTGTEKTKLAGVATGATVNSTDATLLARTNHTGTEPLTALPAGSALVAAKSGTTWPVRPTSRADIIVFWKGADPSPPIVASGTGGMLDGVDIRLVTP